MSGVTTINVCGSPCIRTARHCPTCNRVRPMAGTYGTWYGWMLICIGCGDKFDSEDAGMSRRCERPFAPNWKAERIKSALRMWAKASPMKQEIARQDAEWDRLERTA